MTTTLCIWCKLVCVFVGNIFVLLASIPSLFHTVKILMNGFKELVFKKNWDSLMNRWSSYLFTQQKKR